MLQQLCGQQINSVVVLPLKRSSKSGLVRLVLIFLSSSLMEQPTVRVGVRYAFYLAFASHIPSSCVWDLVIFLASLWVSSAANQSLISRWKSVTIPPKEGEKEVGWKTVVQLWWGRLKGVVVVFVLLLFVVFVIICCSWTSVASCSRKLWNFFLEPLLSTHSWNKQKILEFLLQLHPSTLQV